MWQWSEGCTATKRGGRVKEVGRSVTSDIERVLRQRLSVVRVGLN